MTRLNSEKGKKKISDLLIKRSIDLYGYSPEEKSNENMEWMLQHGYFKDKRHKRGRRGRMRKSGFT